MYAISLAIAMLGTASPVGILAEELSDGSEVPNALAVSEDMTEQEILIDWNTSEETDPEEALLIEEEEGAFGEAEPTEFVEILDETQPEEDLLPTTGEDNNEGVEEEIDLISDNQAELTEVSTGNITIDAVYFPDEKFRNYISQKLDTDSDGILSEKEITDVEYLSVSTSGISSLKGIEYFPNLIRLKCDFNEIATLDLSSNPNLEILEADCNKLTSVNIKRNTKLRYLSLASNELNSLDVSGNSEL